jgi:hypothetical protein
VFLSRPAITADHTGFEYRKNDTLSVDQIKNRMDGRCDMNWGEEKCIQDFGRKP